MRMMFGLCLQKFLQDMTNRSRVYSIGETFEVDGIKGTEKLAAMILDGQLHSQLSFGVRFVAAYTFFGGTPKYPPEDPDRYNKTHNTTVLKVSAVSGTSNTEPCLYPTDAAFHLPVCSVPLHRLHALQLMQF